MPWDSVILEGPKNTAIVLANAACSARRLPWNLHMSLAGTLHFLPARCECPWDGFPCPCPRDFLILNVFPFDTVNFIARDPWTWRWREETKRSLMRQFDWCCFYYFVRNSLVALLEALCARIFSLDSWISVFSELDTVAQLQTGQHKGPAKNSLSDK